MSRGRKLEANAARFEKAIEALLRCSTVADAAREAGEATSTFRRMISRADFQEQLREARRAALDGALVYISGLSQKAAKVVEEALDNRAVSATRLRAAQWTIEKAIDGRVLELEARVSKLEEVAGGPA